MVARWCFIRGRMKMPYKMKNVSPFVSPSKKALTNCFASAFLFALPQGLEPWTL